MNRIYIAMLCLSPIDLSGQAALFSINDFVTKSMAVSPDGKSIALETESSDVVLWDIGTRKQFMRLIRTQIIPNEDNESNGMPDMDGTNSIGLGVSNEVQFTPDGQNLILRSTNGAAVWNIREENQILNIHGKHDKFDISADLKFIATIKPWRSEFEFEPAHIHGRKFDPPPDTILIYSLPSGATKRFVPEIGFSVTRIRFDHGASNLLLSNAEGHLCSFNYLNGAVSTLKSVYTNSQDQSADYNYETIFPAFSFESFAVHPTLRLIALSDLSGRLYIYDLSAQNTLDTLPPSAGGDFLPGQGFLKLSFSNNGKYLVTIQLVMNDGALNKKITFWDVLTRKEVKSIQINALFSSFSYSPDGKYFSISSYGKTNDGKGRIIIYDAETLAEINSFEGKWAPAFFPNEPKRFVYSSQNGIFSRTIK